MQLTIFEVLDNYFGSQNYPSVDLLNNGKIRELREHIVTFYDGYQPPENKEQKTRFFLGSFLSSPPFTLETGPYLASALLCADAVIIFDPLHHWFSDEQYKRSRLMSAPPGWKVLVKKDPTGKSDKQVLRPNYPITRMYLSQILPWMVKMRPLIDAGLILLIPADKIVHSNLSQINTFAQKARSLYKLRGNWRETFSPDEITVDDNRKGMFGFVAGDRQKQIEKAIGQGIDLFTKDVVIANATHSLYTAPFRWEHHLGQQLLNGFATSEREMYLLEGVKNLRLPILANLSPEILVKIHKDSGYSGFRTGLAEVLHQVNAEIGSERFRDRVHQIEQEILLPKIDKIHKETTSDVFRRVTNAVTEGLFTFVQTYLANTPTDLEQKANLASSAVSAGISVIKELIKSAKTSQDTRIWASLLPEQSNISIYGSPLTIKDQPGMEWNTAPIPSNTISISKGVMKLPFVLKSADELRSDTSKGHGKSSPTTK